MSEAAFPVAPARRRHPRLGYLMAAVAAALWGLNGGVSKTILATGLSSERLAQVVTRRRLQARPPHMPPVIHDLERTSGPRALPRGMSQPLMRQERDAEWVPPPHPRRPP